MSNSNDVTASSLPSSPKVLVDSSSIQGYSYDAQSYVLDVWYKSSRSLYRYFNVFPPVVSQVFDSGANIGKKAHETLRQYKYTKLR